METVNMHRGLASNPNIARVTAKSPKGSAQFVLPRETTIWQFKEELSKHFRCETCQLVLVFFGRILQDQRTLRQCGISDGMTVHLVIRSLKRDPEDSTLSSYMPRTSSCALAPTSTGLALPALNPIAQGSWGPLETNLSSMEWHQMPTSEMLFQKVRQLILANPEIQQLAQQFPALCHILNNMSIMRVILDKMRETMDLAKNPDMEQDLKNPEPLPSSVQSNTPGGDNPWRQREAQEPGPNAGQDPLATPSPSVTLARNPPSLEHRASGGEWGGSHCPGSFPVSSSYGAFRTKDSSSDEGGIFSSLPGPLRSPLAGLGPGPGAGPCSVGGIQALIVNLCSAYTQRVMLSLMQNALLASEGTPAGRQDRVQQQLLLQNFYRQMQRPEMAAAVSNPKAIQAWVQMEQGLQVLMEEAPVLVPWFALRLKGSSVHKSATGSMAIGSPSEEELAALE